jgi:hypothetical protein
LPTYFLRAALVVTDGASSSQGLGGIVGPTRRIGAGDFGAMFRSPRFSWEPEEAFTLALNRVATANRIVAAAKSLVFAKVLDIGYAPGIGFKPPISDFYLVPKYWEVDPV